MSEVRVAALATYLPAFEAGKGRRQVGPDEDAVTLAVEAGRAAIGAVPAAIVDRVVVVSRHPALVKGGSGPVLAAALGVDDAVVIEQLGGAPAALDAVLAAAPGTLVIGADVGTPAGAGAALVADSGLTVKPVGRRVSRSLPMGVAAPDGSRADYDDPRLLRERGTKASLRLAGLDRPVDLLAGATAKGLADLVAKGSPALATNGAAATFFALAELRDLPSGATVAALEDAELSAVESLGGESTLARADRPAKQLPKRRLSAESEIRISLPAYERAFEEKLGLRAGRCPRCETLALPSRRRCLGCGREGDQDLVPLARTGEVHTTTTVHVPVPGIETPYSLAIVAIDDSDVRLLGHVTEADPGEVAIGDHVDLVLRRVAIRSGVPDYGYAFRPVTKGAE